MQQFEKLHCFALLGSAAAFGFIVGCSGDSSDDVVSELPDSHTTLIDSVVNVADTNLHGDTVGFHQDTLKAKVDTVRSITERGDTVFVYDTIYLSKDTSVRWVGNSSLRITELTPINLSWLDEDGEDGAWIEIHNSGDSSANLKGYSLVENLKSPRKWVFGDEIIKPNSSRVVFCDKKNIKQVTASESNDRHLRTHTNWKLDRNGGTVYLIDIHYGIRDSVAYPAIATGDMSYGIVDGGIWKYFEKPTPEAPNTESKAYDALAPKIDLSQIKSGFYSEPLTLNPPKLSNGVQLRCTQDGSVPNSSSPEFKDPITFSQNTTLRCSAFKEGSLTKQVVTKNFFIGETVQMPVVAISVDPKFFSEHYVKTECSSPKGCPDSAALYQDKEYPVYVEYFEKGSASDGPAWGVNAGIDLMGGWSRLNRKKSVKISMREIYEDGRINYSLFETRKKADDKYKSFNLRNNGNRFVSDYFEDALAGAILEGSGVDYQRSRQVVVFYNGDYYGIHDMRERYNEHYVENNYGIDANSVEMVKHLGGLDRITSNAGTIDNYVAMLNFIGSNSFEGENNENYNMVKTLIDIGNYADYMAAEIYYKNGDWPNNNLRAWRSPEQPWKFMVYDIDHGFGWKWGVNNGEFDANSTNMFSWIEKGGGNDPCKETGCFANIYIKLIKNPDFMRLFINRSSIMWNKYLNHSRVDSVVDAMAKTLVSTEMDRDLEKYHQDEKGYGSFDRTGSTMKSWAAERDPQVVSEYRDEFGLGEMVKVTVSAQGDGFIAIEGRNLGSSYSGKFYSGMKMEIQALSSDKATFTGWSDGVIENPRIVEVQDGATFTANFN